MAKGLNIGGSAERTTSGKRKAKAARGGRRDETRGKNISHRKLLATYSRFDHAQQSNPRLPRPKRQTPDARRQTPDAPHHTKRTPPYFISSGKASLAHKAR
ncbi:hypothetical protein K438DRAFT_2000504 [Mycena galopus ATCC 62051]|nr:hypothetical protein K438DRAFT_2000504 [Mycena galopus ATCC 62051]